MIFTGPSDVSALVLTMGEASTQSALDSIDRQTLPVHETIVVRNVAPFHRALNAGAGQIKTPFFVQVDSDMILDPPCIAALRSGVRPQVGIVVARLRDALVGQVVGIKLFRTECFETAAVPDSISPDTDFADAIALAGWKREYIGKIGRGELDQWSTLGEHRPTYTPAYTYRKHLLEGCRYRHRRTLNGLRWRLNRLEESQHPLAPLAQIGLARGLFLAEERDLLGPGDIDESFPRLDAFLHAPRNPARSDDAVLPPADGTVEERFHWAYRMGHRLYGSGDASALLRLMRMLNGAAQPQAMWVAKAALCQGLLALSIDTTAVQADFARLQALVDPDLGAITAYAAQIGLNRFVVAGPTAAEYQAQRSDSGRLYSRTGRTVTGTTDRRGRPRITVPFRPLGNIACTDPERLSGIAWCLDLLKSGYSSIHLPTARGPKKVSVVRLLARNIADRAGLEFALPTGLDRAFRKLSRNRSLRYRPEAGRVLMIVSTFGLGGAERQMVMTAAGLIRRGYDVRLLAMNPLEDGAASVDGELSGLGISAQLVSDFPAPRGGGWVQPPSDTIDPVDLSDIPEWMADRIRSISLAIQYHRPAVVHTWLDGPAVIGGLAACALGVPRLVIEQASMSIRHHSNQAASYILSGYRHVAGNARVGMLNNCAAGAADYENWLGMGKGKVRVVYNGFSPESMRTPTPEEVALFRSGHGVSAEAPVVGALIRLVEDKDPTLWLDTAAEIARVRPEVRFLLAGNGPLHSAIAQRAEVLGLGNRLILPGALSDIGLVYGALDVVLLTSSVEGVPNVLVEAQAAGRPIVTTDVGGIREAVLDTRTALVVRQRKAGDLAQAVLAILADPSWQTRVRSEGPAFVTKRFGLERMIDETLDAYGLPKLAQGPTELPMATADRRSTHA